MIVVILILAGILFIAISAFLIWAVRRSIHMAHEDHMWRSGDHEDPDPWVEDFEEGKT